MTINEALTKQLFIVALKFKDGDSELSKDLMVKIMKARIALNKIKTAFNADVKTAADGFMTDDFKKLQEKGEKRTKKENEKYTELVNIINDEINSYINSYVQDEVKDNIDLTFTEDEYNELLPINVDAKADINGQEVEGPNFLEAFYTLFVK